LRAEPRSDFRTIMTLAIMFLILLSCDVVHVVAARPAWLKEGVYMKYVAGDDIGSSDWDAKDPEIVFTWRCISIAGENAELNLTFTWNITAYQTRTLNAVVFVNTENRSIALQNGTYLGETWLWLPANPKNGETINLTSKQTATADVSGWVTSCQGAQRTFVPRAGVADWGFYDLDTGIPTGPEFGGDPVFRALGTEGCLMALAETNVDLGPREWLMELILALPMLLPFIALGGVLVFVFHRRYRKRRIEKTLRKESERKTSPQSRI